MSNEKRRYPRVDEALKISVANASDQFATQTVNVSCGGALCTLDRAIPLMTKVAVELALPKRLVHCTGVVVRCEPNKKNGSRKRNYQLALYFLELNRQDHRAIAEFVLGSMFTRTHHAYRRT